MSELQQYYDSFSSIVASGELCSGENCSGWFVSDVDTIHRCPCGKGTAENHPDYELPEE